MATLKIGDRSVTVDDAFLRMTPDEQNAAVDEIAGSLGGAPAAAAAAPVAPAQMLPEVDAMGNPTGGMMEAAAPQMGYGDQMKNVGRVLDNGARLAGNALSFGMADRIAGGMDAVTGAAPSYDEGVNRQAARTQAIRDANPELATAVEVGSGVVGGAGLIKNGVTVAGRVGSKLLPRIIGFGAEGATYGGLHGAGSTYTGDWRDNRDAAWAAAKTGAQIGAGMPLVGAAAGAAYRGVQALAAPALPGVSRSGSTALRMAAQADEAGLRSLPQMGPEAMLPDAGPSMLGLAQGAATSAGPGRSELVGRLVQREAGTGQRLADAVDGALGPAPIPSQVERSLQQSRRALGPEYERALEGARAVDTAPIAQRIEAMIPDARGPARAALESARSDLNIPGNPGFLDPSPRALLNVRHALDDALESAPNNVKSVIGDVRRWVDDELAAKVPGVKAVDAKFQEVMRQREGLQRGQAIFDTDRASVLRPVELADEFSAGAIPRGEMIGPSGVPYRVRQGARAELDRTVGTQVNDLNALERKLGTNLDWNNQKARTVFGDQPIETVVDAIRTNRAFRNTMQKVVEGSKTAPTSANAKALVASDGPRADLTLTGMAASGIQRVARALMSLNSSSTKDQVARVLASPNVEAVADQLLRQATRTAEGARTVSRALANPAYLGGVEPANGRRGTR